MCACVCARTTGRTQCDRSFRTLRILCTNRARCVCSFDANSPNFRYLQLDTQAHTTTQAHRHHATACELLFNYTRVHTDKTDRILLQHAPGLDACFGKGVLQSLHFRDAVRASHRNGERGVAWLCFQFLGAQKDKRCILVWTHTHKKSAQTCRRCPSSIQNERAIDGA